MLVIIHSFYLHRAMMTAMSKIQRHFVLKICLAKSCKFVLKICLPNSCKEFNLTNKRAPTLEIIKQDQMYYIITLLWIFMIWYRQHNKKPCYWTNTMNFTLAASWIIIMMKEVKILMLTSEILVTKLKRWDRQKWLCRLH